MAAEAPHPSFGAVRVIAAVALDVAEHTLRVLITALLWVLAATAMLSTVAAAAAGSAAVPVVLAVDRALALLAPAAGTAVAATACPAVASAVTRGSVPLVRAACGGATRAACATSRAAPVAATVPRVSWLGRRPSSLPRPWPRVLPPWPLLCHSFLAQPVARLRGCPSLHSLPAVHGQHVL